MAIQKRGSTSRSAERGKKSKQMKKCTPKKQALKKRKRQVSKKIIKRKISTKITTKKGRKKIVKKTKIVIEKSCRRKKRVKTGNKGLTSELKVKLRKRRFYAWKSDDFVIKTLEKRGWKYMGEPVPNGREDYPKSLYEAKEQGKFDEPHALYWADDDDSRVLQGVSQTHLISSLPNSCKSLTKVAQQRLFNEEEWFPTCFTLPKEKDLLAQYCKKNPKSFWIAKPRDGYGGFGMCVFKTGSDEFKRICERKTTFVVQKYMANPYLLAKKFKFHFRCYMVITHAAPMRAYLYRNAQLQFCTHEFDLNKVEKKFNKYCHITNYKVNNEKKNQRFLLENKPGVGSGSEWSLKTFFEYQKVHDKQFSQRKFWKDLTAMAKVVARKLSGSKPVMKSFDSEMKDHAFLNNHFEIYGLDVIIDENRNLQLTEANTQPGLDWTDPTMSNGVFNPEIVRANDITAGVINDTMNLLGVDKPTKPFSKWVKLH